MVMLAHQENILLDPGTCSILVNISLLYQNVSLFFFFPPNKLKQADKHTLFVFLFLDFFFPLCRDEYIFIPSKFPLTQVAFLISQGTHHQILVCLWFCYCVPDRLAK